MRGNAGKKKHESLCGCLQLSLPEGVYWKAGNVARCWLRPACDKDVEKMGFIRGEFEFYSVSICLPAILIALVVMGIYLKERSKKL